MRGAVLLLPLLARTVTSTSVIITLTMMMTRFATTSSAAAAAAAETVRLGRSAQPASRSAFLAAQRVRRGQSSRTAAWGTFSTYSSSKPTAAPVREFTSFMYAPFSTTPPGASLLRMSLAEESDLVGGSEQNQQQWTRSASSSDQSSAARSRAPFSSPRGSVDDTWGDGLTDGPSVGSKGIQEKGDDVEQDGTASWSKLGLLNELSDLLGTEYPSGPTPVQRMAIPAILGGYKPTNAAVGSATNSGRGGTAAAAMQSLAFAAATGSGKTLAYLLPIVQMLKSDELLSLQLPPEQQSRLRRPKRPRAIILAPTRELSHQILTVLKQLGHAAKISSELLVGGEDYGKQRKRLESRPVDVVVATPGRLVKHRDASNVYLGSVRHVVIDEFDTMLEQGFQGDIGLILHPLLYKRKVVMPNEAERMELVEEAPQIVLTTATMTKAVRRLLDDPTVEPKRMGRQRDDVDKPVNILLPSNIRVLTAPGLHRAVPRLRQTFVDVGNADKLGLLNDIVAGSGGEGSVLVRSDGLGRNSGAGSNKGEDKKGRALTLVFCNTVPSCRAAQHSLAEAGVPSLCYHGDLSSADRAANLRSFRDAAASTSSPYEEDEDAPRVLVCTDIAARGLDVPEVDHVVMFDFPLNPIGYLHRAGRTARASTATRSTMRPGSGRVTALVAKRDRVLAGAIEGAVQRGEPLDELSSRKSDYLPGGRLSGQRRQQQRGSSGDEGPRGASGGRGGGRGRGRGGGGRGNGRRPGGRGVGGRGGGGRRGRRR